MSADNAIVIMKFQDGYKVRHMQAVDNLYWNPIKEEVADTLWLQEVYDTFKNCFILRTEDIAMKVALRLLDEYGYVEYGIITIESPASWNMISRYYGKTK